MIVHVSASQFGGAGTAARRLHDGLLRQGDESKFLTSEGVASESRAIEVLPRRYPRLWRRIARKFGYGLTARERWDQKTKALNCPEVFTSGIESDSGLLNSDSMRHAGLINLHWVAGILPWAAFFQTNSKPLVWTLHDMNPFMGIFHYELDRKRGGKSAHEMDDQVRRHKKQLLRDTRPPVIVTPSVWLQRHSEASELFCQFRHEHIPYGLDTQIFRPHPQAFARSVFGLPQTCKLMLVVAERLDDHRKGFDLLLDAVRQPVVEKDWELVAVGDGALPLANLKYHRVGAISDERLMSLIYSAVDLTVIASREDNFPNVVLESLCCGTPVVTTPAGGMVEAIVPGRDGNIAEDITAAALRNAIQIATRKTFDRHRITTEAVARYDSSIQARRYSSLYKELAQPIW